MVTLEPLMEGRFTTYREQLLRRYSNSIAQAWQVDQPQADSFAALQIDSLLPKGVNTSHHQLRQIFRADEPVGVVWFSNQPGSIAYVYDLYIEPDARRAGIGTLVISAIENEVAGQGCFALSLHVFEENAAAQQFYQSIGLRPIGTQLFKRLSHAGAA